MTRYSSRFTFGRNWQSFVRKHFSDERVSLAQQSLRDLLGLRSLRGHTFLDVGCGSGLFSLAAVRMDADRVTSFDYDADSVTTAEWVRSECDIAPQQWQIYQGSILDDEFMGRIEPADVVYCWGVAHHTGDMWQAMDNLVNKIKPGGLLELAVYNKVDRRVGGSKFWLAVKKTYHRSPILIQRTMEYVYCANFIMRHLITLRDPWLAIRDYPITNKGRAMDFWHDVRDWLGGYPYEYATAGEIFNYLHGQYGLCLENLTTTYSVGCNQFVFSARGTHSWAPQPARSEARASISLPSAP